MNYNLLPATADYAKEVDPQLIDVVIWNTLK